jgi:hypothetical protein
VTGDEVLGHLLTDLLVKGAIVLVALVLAAALGVALWRRLS